MTNPIGAWSLVTELFGWIGLGLGVVLLIAGFVRRAAFRGWKRTLGVVVVDEHGDLAYRWLGDDGSLYEAPSWGDDTQVLEPGDEVTVFVNPRDPSVGRVEDPVHEGRALRTSGWILVGLGVAAMLVQFALLFF